MGEVRVELTVMNLRTGERSEPLTAVADTGANFSILPATLLERLGIERLRTTGVRLADGSIATRMVGDAAIAIDDNAAPCRVVFGEPHDAVILGLTALEQLELAVDPVRRCLVDSQPRA